MFEVVQKTHSATPGLAVMISIGKARVVRADSAGKVSISVFGKRICALALKQNSMSKTNKNSALIVCGPIKHGSFGFRDDR